MRKILVKILCWFIPSKNLRRILKDRFLYTITLKERKILENNIKTKFKVIEICNEAQSKNCKILHYSTYNQQCGIATFLDDFIEGLKQNNYKKQFVVPVEFDYIKDSRIFIKYLNRILEEAVKYDVISIQHEYAFWICKTFEISKNYMKQINPLVNKYKCVYSANSLYFLDYFVEKLLQMNKKIIITWHTDFDIVLNDIKNFNKIFKYKELPFFRFLDNKKLKIVVLNSEMKNVLIDNNIPIDNVLYYFHPIPTLKNIKILPFKLQKIKNDLCIKKDDIILGSFGFIGKRKGIIEVLNVLKYLPQNYKYLLIGGKHPADTSNFYKNLKEYIINNNLNNRVIITGFLDFADIPYYLQLFNIGIYLCTAENKYASGAINQLLNTNIPIIASNKSSFKDLQKQYNCLEICEDVKNQELIINQINTLLHDKTKINILKNNCKIFCEENTFRNFANNILNNLNVIEINEK